MEVKKGYKQTEVGILPNDWDAKPLCGFVSILHGFGFKGDYFKDSGTYRLTTPGHFHENGGFRDVGEKQKFYDGIVPEGYVLNKDDIIIAMTEQADGLLGSAAIISIDGVYLHNQRLGKLKVTCSGLCDLFLYRVFNSPYYRAKVRETAAGTKVKHTSPSKLLEIPIPLPPTLAEQEAIAGALSDADAWIESLEQLIAKKRQIKQGAMQELLTGKRRLPGFSGKWAKTTLGELGRWAGGMTPSMANSKYWDGGNFPWVSSGDVKSVKLNDTTQHITTTAIRESTTTVMPAGGIIIVNRSGILRRYLPVSLLMRDMAINQDIKGLILKPGLCSEFVLYFILHAGPEILASCMKAGTTVESIELSWLKRFAVQLPNMEEQTAIATVLSDMDTEIESLESKLAKAREIKQGMMQELLTGRIRLIEN
jgi:type I restriction enzyme S subunit